MGPGFQAQTEGKARLLRRARGWMRTLHLIRTPPIIMFVDPHRHHASSPSHASPPHPMTNNRPRECKEEVMRDMNRAATDYRLNFRLKHACEQVRGATAAARVGRGRLGMLLGCPLGCPVVGLARVGVN